MSSLEPAAVWDAQAPSYDASRREDPVYQSCIDQAIDAVPAGTGRCLDAGCGTGLSTAALRGRCAQVIAVDFSLESLRVLKGKAFDNVRLVQADVTALPFVDSAFDAAVCANTLNQLKPGAAQSQACEELGRVTKAACPISISVHHFSRQKRRAGWIKEGKPGQPGIDYIFRFSRQDLRAIVPRARIRAVGYYRLQRLPVFGKRLQNLSARCVGTLAAVLDWGHMLVAVAENLK
jgi:ubiquinone/menaquinone biosynthesis C-methylase UbiE